MINILKFTVRVAASGCLIFVCCCHDVGNLSVVKPPSQGQFITGHQLENYFINLVGKTRLSIVSQTGINLRRKNPIEEPYLNDIQIGDYPMTGELCSTDKDLYVIAILFDRSDRVKEISILDCGKKDGPPVGIIRSYSSKTRSWEVRTSNFGPIPIKVN